MNILGIDVGRTSGWYHAGEAGEIKYKSLLQYYKEVSKLIDKYNPVFVVSARPTRMYNVIVAQTKLLAIVELVCEERGIENNLKIIDSSCKKQVLGNGRASKGDIMFWAKLESEHAADAMLFVEYYKIKNNIT